MHIPDGFLDGRTIAATSLLSAGSVGMTLRRVAGRLEPRRIPLIGLTSAFIFVAQMVNFPVAGGTSGHLIGAVLAAVLAGPAAAVLIMTSVLLTQAFLFADGGVFALGANVLNMAVIAPFSGYAVYRLLRLALKDDRGQLIAASVAAWFSTVAAALACATELAAAGAAPWTTVFPAMTLVHMIIGIGEGMITMLVLAAVSAMRPELLRPERDPAPPRRKAMAALIGAGILIVLVVLLTPYASSLPDGLEDVAKKIGFAGNEAAHPVLPAPMEGYRLPFAGDAVLLVSCAGVIGAVCVALFSLLLARALTARQIPASAGQDSHRQPE